MATLRQLARADIGVRTAGTTEDGRVRGLDGLRGLAVAAVVLFHSQLTFARGGFLGVSAFFTLSGFLITRLLIDERARAGRIRLRAFWARRARRLLPAAFVTLGGVLVFGATVATGDQLRSLRGDVLSALAYVANWRFYFSGRAYAHLFNAPSPVLHFWSLAIEEQFYVVFPLLVAVALRLARGRRGALGALFATGVVASVVAGRVLTSSSGSTRVYYGSDTRAAELLVGALLAVVWTARPTTGLLRTRPGRAVVDAAGLAALAAIVWWWSTVSRDDRWLDRGGFAAHACLTAVVIVAVHVDGRLSRALSWRPLESLGRISYGVYLFHWPIFLWLSAARTGLSAGPLLALRVGVTLALAIASYRLVEQPVLRGTRVRGAARRVLAPLTAGTIAVALLVVTASPPAPSIVLHALGTSRGVAEPSRPRVASHAVPALPPPPTAAVPVAATPLHRPVDGGRPLRMMVVGDSVGVTFGRGIELWARERGDAVVRNLARPWCSLGRYLPRAVGAGIPQNSGAGCDRWAQSWAQEIRTFDPDVVFVLFTVWEVAPRRLPGHDRFAQPGDPELDRWQLSEYQAAADVLSARGAAVVWFTIACEGGSIRRHEPLWYVNRRTIPGLAASRPAVHVVDLDAVLCPNGEPSREFAGVHDARPDGAHFSDPGALALARWLMPIVLGDAPAPPVVAEQPVSSATRRE